MFWFHSLSGLTEMKTFSQYSNFWSFTSKFYYIQASSYPQNASQMYNGFVWELLSNLTKKSLAY